MNESNATRASVADSDKLTDLLDRVPAATLNVLAATDDSAGEAAWERLRELVDQAADAIREVLKAEGPPQGDYAQARARAWVELARALTRFADTHRHMSIGVPGAQHQAEIRELVATVAAVRHEVTLLRVHHQYSAAKRMVARRRPAITLLVGAIPLGLILGLLSWIGVPWWWLVAVFVLANVSLCAVGQWYRTQGQRVLLDWWGEALNAPEHRGSQR